MFIKMLCCSVLIFVAVASLGIWLQRRRGK
ncbi:hypothetical protein BKA14_001934 [Actinoplanes abujensis]|uniref:Uncharacterized protein n=1 Tax=Paractinoplanes abujensis TaxID=882441 RepID=A0A7W7CNI4_9ACTN|nr:hypothetical protein [Actinoplanes abujensis]